MRPFIDYNPITSFIAYWQHEFSQGNMLYHMQYIMTHPKDWYARLLSAQLDFAMTIAMVVIAVFAVRKILWDKTPAHGE